MVGSILAVLFTKHHGQLHYSYGKILKNANNILQLSVMLFEWGGWYFMLKFLFTFQTTCTMWQYVQWDDVQRTPWYGGNPIIKFDLRVQYVRLECMRESSGFVDTRLGSSLCGNEKNEDERRNQGRGRESEMSLSILSSCLKSPIISKVSTCGWNHQ